MNSLQSLCDATPGVRLSELAPGYPLLTLTHGALTATVSLYGGQLLDCRRHDQDWIWRNPTLQFKPSKALRTGVPVCWPWFGSVDPALPAHGIVRTRLWSVEALQHDYEALVLTLDCCDDDASRQLWPHRFHLQLQVRLSNALCIQLHMHNIDDHAYPVAGALHSYFAIDDIASTTVLGLAETEYFDQLSAQTIRQQGDIQFNAETDRVYHIGASNLPIETQRQTLHLQQYGNTDTVVWTPWADKAARLGDIADNDWRQFVCVETAIANQHALMLGPGTSHMMGFTLASSIDAKSDRHGRA